MLTIPYPNIHPDIFTLPPFSIGHWTLGPFSLRWYALAYIAGLIIGWRYCLALARKPPHVAAPQDVDDFLVWATLGVVLGGRIGYVLFYNFFEYLQHPIEIFYVWRGGMSFHGGAIGVFLAIFLFCLQRGIPLLAFADIIVCAVPIGLFFGRLANFINGELWGRLTDVSWAMIFPTGASSLADVPAELRQLCQPTTLFDGNPGLNCPRHPSQLYEAFLEGIILFAVIWAFRRFAGARERPGLLTGVFLMGYALCRIVVEFFRQPDAQLGFLWFGATMGQILSLPFFLVGLFLALRALRTSRTPATV
jgi:phosphatidylglycerol---prolipoprotein diacylglyceryl transferase